MTIDLTKGQLGVTHAITESARFMLDIHRGKKKILREKVLPLLKGKKVLDFGCGCGFYSKWYAEVAESVVAIEQSEGSLRAAMELNSAPNLTFQAELPQGQKFDAIVCNDSLETNKNWRELTETLKGMLVPGGVLILTNENLQYKATLLDKIIYKSRWLSCRWRSLESIRKLDKGKRYHSVYQWDFKIEGESTYFSLFGNFAKDHTLTIVRT